MKKIVVSILFFALSFLSLTLICEASINDLILDFDKVKTKTRTVFRKKQSEQKPKMVETVEEWKNEAQNIPLSERIIKEEKENIDAKKYYVPKLNYTFEAYNYPQGKRELNFENVKKDLQYTSYLVVDNSCRYAAYSKYFYQPETNQISSKFYVEKLDTTKTKTKRILDFKHNQQQRFPVLESGMQDIYSNHFQGLTLVDWSKDSKKLLIKEKIGSTQNGVYKTKLHVYFMKTDIRNGYLLELDDFDEAIKQYYIDWESKQLVRYRYDIEPLGFSAENDNVVVSLLYVYDNDNNKLYLGTWGYDCVKREVILISKEDYTPMLSINGLILRHSYN